MGRKKSSIGCLFWTALVLLVLVIFLFNRNTIGTVLDKTGLLTYLKRDRPPGDEITVERTDEVEDESVQPEETISVVQNVPDQPIAADDEPQTDIQVADEIPEEDTETAPFPSPSQKIRRSRLYFVFVDESGEISLRPIVRPVYYVDSPLTDTLAALLGGLSTDEIRDGLLSLVPEGSEILGIAVREGTAFIDFNESFRFNSFGGEGYKSQLQQIVYTATEFQTVKSVQFLINGERRSYLGPESPYIGEPLTRQSL
jgi:germination protein M